MTSIKLTIIAAIISSLLGAFSTYKICEIVYNNRLEAQKEELRVEKEMALTAERTICAENQQITKRHGDELQKKYETINDRFNRLNNGLRVAAPDGACMHITRTGRSDDESARGKVLPVLGGVSVGEFTGKLKIADEQTARLMQCQDYVAEVTKRYRYEGQ